MRQRVFRFTTAIVLVAAGGVGLMLYQAATAAPIVNAEEQADLLRGPSDWVEFTAVATKTEVASPPVVGRFFRGADGSERLDTGPTLDDVRSIMIKNLTSERYFTWDLRAGWVSGPMDVPAELKRPLAYRKGMFADSPPIRYGEFDAVQMTTREGSVTRLVPALNFFAVDRVSPAGGRILFSDIHVGSLKDFLATLPPKTAARYSDVISLFEPPPGAEVRHTTVLGGIVRRDAGGGPGR